VLDWRGRQHEDALRLLAAARQALAASEAAAVRAREQLASSRERTRVTEAGGCDQATRAWHWNWIVRCEADVTRADAVVAARLADTDIAAGTVAEARKRLRPLEKLRDRARQEHADEERRIEQKALDALAVTRYVRSDGGEW
jgi:flagellar biosynthesis chaperone FliJ